MGGPPARPATPHGCRSRAASACKASKRAGHRGPAAGPVPGKSGRGRGPLKCAIVALAGITPWAAHDLRLARLHGVEDQRAASTARSAQVRLDHLQGEGGRVATAASKALPPTLEGCPCRQRVAIQCVRGHDAEGCRRSPGGVVKGLGLMSFKALPPRRANSQGRGVGTRMGPVGL